MLRKSREGIVFNEHLDGDGAAVFKHACKLGLEGIVSKRREMRYRSGRSKAWLKIKNPKSPAMLRVEDGTF
jgi:bifunctional non-homologous end joining protein LigD